MIVQIVTGIFLTFFYAPSAATAWESTRAIYLNPYTHFLLSVHYWGSSAMIALVFLHLLQVLVWGAYKSPRELQWVVGVLLLLVTLVLGLTGYLLAVGHGRLFRLAGLAQHRRLAPVAGPFLQHFAQGGGGMGTATINRFFGLHVWLMPAVSCARWRALRDLPPQRLGRAGRRRPAQRSRPGRFWPDQLFMDGAFSLIVFIIICFLALVAPPYLDAKADPTNFFVPYPAWYFLSLFGLLALVPPEVHLGPLTISTELIATIVVPTLFLLVILFIPWLDRSTTRSFGARSGILWGATVVICTIVGLTIYAQITTMAKQAAAPASPPESVVLSAAAATLPSASAPGTSPLRVPAVAPPHRRVPTVMGRRSLPTTARRVTVRKGKACPVPFRRLRTTPTVTGDPNKVIGIVLGGLHEPITVNGQSYNGQMPPWKGTLSNKEIADVITYIRGSLANNKASAVTPAQVANYKP